ncbi:MAG: response regulator [Kaiparowitsia implicata GSE-PSE-MK54-09C]|jgi:twitching motility two-component system response regulator PilG|nr:response regulator [Kaiparowitsia implicata GSE-PSE-MK54-09C]
MQGNLNEIDIRSVLQLIELGQRTGELFVEAYSAPSWLSEPTAGHSALWNRVARAPIERSWFVFFLNGRIVYAGDAGLDLARLRDHLKRYNMGSTPNALGFSSAIATTSAPEYGHLWAMIENNTLTPAQGRSIIASMVNETLFDLLTLHHGSFTFEIGQPLAPQLSTLETGGLVSVIIKQVQEWKQLHPLIQSPDQCPAIADAPQLRETLNTTVFNNLAKWVDGNTSIRQVARYLNRDILTVARALYPCIQQGLVHLQPPPSARTALSLPTPTPHAVPRIVCIDDGLSIRKTVEHILNQQGYEATAIGNPLKALSLLFQLKPDLILCDISMPELDGYELCAMLRKSSTFRQTPIIMLTGRDGFIDRIKAKIVGASDYLTKPFGEHELLTLVEANVGPGNADYPTPSRLLADDLEHELELDIAESTSTTPLN